MKTKARIMLTLIGVFAVTGGVFAAQVQKILIIIYFTFIYGATAPASNSVTDASLDGNSGGTETTPAGCYYTSEPGAVAIYGTIWIYIPEYKGDDIN